MSKSSSATSQAPPITTVLAGNPNVGKSTLFNGMTGMKQKTGNWAGVTVSASSGHFSQDGRQFCLVDLPGTSALNPHSPEEAATREFLCSGQADLILVVCAASCLERGLFLLKEIIALDMIQEKGTPLILCLNLIDEAKKKGISIDTELLSDVLQIPVLACCARRRSSIIQLKKLIAQTAGEKACYHCLDFSPKQLTAATLHHLDNKERNLHQRVDLILTHPISGACFMLSLLFLVFWITLSGANQISDALWNLLFRLEPVLIRALTPLSLPDWFKDMIVNGGYRVLAWVISVMLPPMAIFFPLFTLLEDSGLLPRIAFNTDHHFRRCHACGKQCLTAAMGFGCNAAGVTGCRIIDSPRERLIAILTNSFIPCNGRLPSLMLLSSMLFLTLPASEHTSAANAQLFPALILTGAIFCSILSMMGASWLLSRTLLRGLPSAFTLELPPYRTPQPGKILLRSLLDRTLIILGRAVAVALPAGFIIWLLANISFTLSNEGILIALSPKHSLLLELTSLLNPLGQWIGLDGAILCAFLLALPANEILLPLILMIYQQSPVLTQLSDTETLTLLLESHGWTIRTILCCMVFCVLHWPCSTTILTIKKETGSWFWTAVSIFLPTLMGIGSCILISVLLTPLVF